MEALDSARLEGDYRNNSKKAKSQIVQIKSQSLNNVSNILTKKPKQKWDEKIKRELNNFQFQSNDLLAKEILLAQKYRHQLKQIIDKSNKQKEEINLIHKKQDFYKEQYQTYKDKYQELYSDN
jgi:hypothetical protein